MEIEITSEAWIVVHTGPEGLLPETEKAHAFGPFTDAEEAENWGKDAPDTCMKFVLPMRVVRMMIAGDLMTPPRKIRLGDTRN